MDRMELESEAFVEASGNEVPEVSPSASTGAYSTGTSASRYATMIIPRDAVGGSNMFFSIDKDITFYQELCDQNSARKREVSAVVCENPEDFERNRMFLKNLELEYVSFFNEIDSLMKNDVQNLETSFVEFKKIIKKRKSIKDMIAKNSKIINNFWINNAKEIYEMAISEYLE